jgi:hypothetical protein
MLVGSPLHYQFAISAAVHITAVYSEKLDVM